MYLIIKKLLIIFIIIIAPISNQSKVLALNNYDFDDYGLISIMYHRFNENKYPSTNIRIEAFKKHINIIKENKLEFLNPKNFEYEFNKVSNKKKVLLTLHAN